MNKKIGAVLAVLIAVVMIVCPMQVAADGIDPDRRADLTIRFSAEDPDEPGKMIEIAGATFDIYRVATVDKNMKFTKIAPFVDYPVSLTVKTDAEWYQLAETLKGYAQKDAIVPTFSLTTDEKGLVQITGIDTGLYLVLGHTLEVGNDQYIPVPSIVALPGTDENGNLGNYNVTVEPKATVYRRYPSDKTISKKVLKEWNDKSNQNKRPKNISVELLANGKVYDTVTLNAENNWRYQWDQLPLYDEQHQVIDWAIVEAKIKNYTVRVEQNGITFLVINTFNENKPPQPPKDPLPQTGLLWWPVPVLLFAGAAFLLAGVIRRRRADR